MELADKANRMPRGACCLCAIAALLCAQLLAAAARPDDRPRGDDPPARRQLLEPQGATPLHVGVPLRTQRIAIDEEVVRCAELQRAGRRPQARRN